MTPWHQRAFHMATDFSTMRHFRPSQWWPLRPMDRSTSQLTCLGTFCHVSFRPLFCGHQTQICLNNVQEISVQLCVKPYNVSKSLQKHQMPIVNSCPVNFQACPGGTGFLPDDKVEYDNGNGRKTYGMLVSNLFVVTCFFPWDSLRPPKQFLKAGEVRPLTSILDLQGKSGFRRVR